jgi:hypothetical protein
MRFSEEIKNKTLRKEPRVFAGNADNIQRMAATRAVSFIPFSAALLPAPLPRPSFRRGISR